MKVLGDDFLQLLQDALQEMVDLEDFFFMSEAIFILESDMKNYKEIEKKMATLIGFLKSDEIRGESALTLWRKEIVKVSDLYYRLIESGSYDKLKMLYDYDENDVRR